MATAIKAILSIFFIAAVLGASPAAAHQESESDTGWIFAGIGVGTAALGYFLAGEQEDDAENCRMLNSRDNSGGDSLLCANQSDLDERVDDYETVGLIGLAGVGLGAIMILTDDAAADSGFIGGESVLTRHFNAVHFAADKESLLKISYHSPDVSGLAFSYSGIGGFGLSKEWAF